MGALSFVAFKEILKFRGGNNAALDAAGASGYNYYGIWINSAYRLLCTQDNILGLPKKIKFPQLFVSTTKTTVDGTATIDAPTDNLFITEVFDTTNSRKLHQISWKKYVEYTDRTDTAAEGDPTDWTHRGSYVYLHPTPGTTGDTMTIYYKKLVADLTGSQTTAIGAEWDDVILELATYKMETWLHDYEKAKFAREAFLEMAGGLADNYLKGELDSDLTIGPSASYMPGF